MSKCLQWKSHILSQPSSFPHTFFFTWISHPPTHLPPITSLPQSVYRPAPLPFFSARSSILCNPVLLVQPSCPCLSCCDFLPYFTSLQISSIHPSLLLELFLTCSHMKKNMKKSNNRTICICIFWIPLLNWLDTGGPREWVPMSRFNQIEFR